jgi:hypothetical protein
MFDGDTKTTTSKLPQHPFSYPIKLYFQGWLFCWSKWPQRACSCHFSILLQHKFVQINKWGCLFWIGLWTTTILSLGNIVLCSPWKQKIMQQKNTIIDILTMEKGSFPWWPSWFFCVELSPFIYMKCMCYLFHKTTLHKKNCFNLFFVVCYINILKNVSQNISEISFFSLFFSCSFSCIHMFVLPENKRLCNKIIQSLIY